MDFDRDSKIVAERDETFSRTMGQRLDTAFKTNNDTYGRFSDIENKYKKTGVKEKIFEDFFKAYVNNEKSEKSKLDESIQNIRLYDTTNRNIHITQPNDDLHNLGKRHMKTQDDIPVNAANIDKLFMASHDMSKQPSLLNQTQVNSYVDKFTPYYKDKEITYWSMNLDKGNIYRSHALGENAFAKTSGFTQPIHQSKSIKQFNGNVTNSSTSKNIFLNERDLEFSEKYRNSVLQNSQIVDLSPEITRKVMETCFKKGSMGLRKLRIFLRNLHKRKSDFIDKSNFKYFFINFGITFTEKEVEFIYNKFDIKKNNHINFNEFLNQFVFYPEDRRGIIKAFYETVKTNHNSYVSFKKIEKLFSADQHPEVTLIYFYFRLFIPIELHRKLPLIIWLLGIIWRKTISLLKKALLISSGTLVPA